MIGSSIYSSTLCADEKFEIAVTFSGCSAIIAIGTPYDLRLSFAVKTNSMIISYKGFRKLRRGAYVLGIVVLLMNLVFISLYFYRFHGKLSGQSADWANFGSFLAGTVGVSVSVMTLLGVTYFTIKVGRATQQQFLTTLRAPAYKTIIDELYKVRSETYRIGINLENFKTWINNVDFDSLLFLRPDQIPLFEKLRLKLLRDFEPLMTTKPDTDFAKQFEKFDNSKSELIKFLKYVMKETNN